MFVSRQVIVVPPNPDWEEAFKRASTSLAGALGANARAMQVQQAKQARKAPDREQLHAGEGTADENATKAKSKDVRT